MTLLGIRLDGGEQIPVSVEFRLLDTNNVPVAGAQTLHLRQFPTGSSRDTTPYGNVSFEVQFDGGQDNGRKAAHIGNTVTSEKDYAVYPNPASSMVYIERLNADAAKLQIQMVDATGKCVGSTTMDSSAQLGSIRTAGLSSGTYFVEIISEGKRMISYKIIVK